MALTGRVLFLARVVMAMAMLGDFRRHRRDVRGFRERGREGAGGRQQAKRHRQGDDEAENGAVRPERHA